jgi:hypothetical protein
MGKEKCRFKEGVFKYKKRRGAAKLSFSGRIRRILASPPVVLGPYLMRSGVARSLAPSLNLGSSHPRDAPATLQRSQIRALLLF